MAKARKSASSARPAAPALPVVGPAGKPSLARALTPRLLLDSTPAEWLWRIGAERRHLLLLAAFAALIFFPYLGSVGFWDPWEVHYGEVARSMLVREDFVHPYWENAYFFSKPVLSLWMQALGMILAGTNDPARGISASTEWWVRSVFALVAIGGVLFTYLAAARTLSRRAGVWAAVIVATSPLYFLLARQAMVDMPFVAFNTMAIACLMIALFEKEHVQDGWLYAFYALAGVSTLAKGLLGIALPGAAMLGYLVLSGDWRVLARLRLITGPLVTLLVCGPWYGAMIAFDGKDDESRTFFQRFFIHDHFKRLGIDPVKGKLIKGVHTTTPDTTFVYYLEQLGFGLFPWVAAIPGALASVMRAPAPEDVGTRRRKARLFVLAWLLTTFAFFAFAATKFHHYAFPALPPLCILIALWVEELLEEGVTKNAMALVLGGVLFALVAQNLTLDPSHLVNLYVYRYDRAYPMDQVDPRSAFTFLFIGAVAVALMGVPMLRRLLSRKAVTEDSSDRLYVVGALAILATVFAVYVSSVHWPMLSPHWSQRALFTTYLQQSQPSEPIAAYQMNWRGETFYSRNTVRQLRQPVQIREFASKPGREWVLTEPGKRFENLQKALGSRYNVRAVDTSNNKYVLAVIEDARE